MIAFNDVIKVFPEQTIRYRDMTFEDHKSYLILGASGSGKTTLLNLIAGVVKADGGKIYLDGDNIVRKSQSFRDKLRTRRIGYIYQDFKLIEDMSVEDNIRILEICAVPSKGLAAVTAELEIADKLKRKVRTLSGGEKQRVAIARAMIKKPDMILADEPTGSLHHEIGDAVIHKLIGCAKGKLLIVVSHDTRLAEYFDVVVNLDEKGGLAYA